MYKLFRNLLFLFDPEKVHYFTMNMLKILFKIPGFKSLWSNYYTVNNKKLETTVFGLTFKNPVGLAAGFDKNAAMYNELAACGFGFIEIAWILYRKAVVSSRYASEWTGLRATQQRSSCAVVV